MIKYESFQYIFPPRPKNPIQPSDLKMWDNDVMVAQPKMNGSNCTIYINNEKCYVYNRHGQRLSNFNIETSEIKSLFKGKGWMVINGEYMNKSKRDHNGELFNDKFCLFDILVFENQHLVGSTFEYRIQLLNSLYGTGDSFVNRITSDVYRVASYYTDYENIYKDLIEIDMVEGLVLKRKSAKLEIGSSENNNVKSQIKVRKPTKNYKY
jgi:ATP-dependent DNA ligase